MREAATNDAAAALRHRPRAAGCLRGETGGNLDTRPVGDMCRVGWQRDDVPHAGVWVGLLIVTAF
jgi:hypothetical protein